MPVVQELWAVGSNMHGQLSHQERAFHEPDVVKPFKKIAVGSYIHVLDASWSQTVYTMDGSQQALGNNARGWSPYESINPIYPKHRAPGRLVSTHNGVQTFFLNNDCIILLPRDPRDPTASKATACEVDGATGRLTHLACSTAGVCSAAFRPLNDKPVSILMYNSLQEVLNSLGNYDPYHSPTSRNVMPQPVRKFRLVHPGAEPFAAVQSLVATKTAFAALVRRDPWTAVYTWGDVRFRHVFGRSSQEYSAVVQDLVGLTIKEITSGGDMIAALTDAGDAFIWGSHDLEDYGHRTNGSGSVALDAMLGNNEIGEHIAKISIVPNTADHEIEDIAIGNRYVIVLDSNGLVWVCGSNGGYQLGLVGQAAYRAVNHWEQVKQFTQMPVDGSRSVKCKRVYAGPSSSFVVVERTSRT